MSLIDASLRWQARIAGLLGRHRDPSPSLVEEDRLLTQSETASMLQPRMRNRDALAWLEVDRNLDPSLRFVSEGGEILYRLAEVRAFIRRLPHAASAEQATELLQMPAIDRRSGDDRRNDDLFELIEDRRTMIDRRSGFDRRNGLDRREAKDDFGYGRNGERRGLAGKL
ncbi:MAG: hypothetical protein H0U63_07055 [Burkholderiales bacterium]|nr:hypothetical protein [Burkholderiales bacterium]